MADFTGQQFRINPVGPRQGGIQPGTPDATAMTPTSQVPDLGVDMTGLQDIEGLTDSVYGMWGDIQKFAGEMNSLGIDVTRPNPMIPESYEANKIFTTMMATLRNEVNALQQGAKGDAASQQAVLYGKGDLNRDVTSDKFYGGDVFRAMTPQELDPMVMQYNRGVQTAMDSGEDIKQYEHIRDKNIIPELERKRNAAVTQQEWEYWNKNIKALLDPKKNILLAGGSRGGSGTYEGQLESIYNTLVATKTSPLSLIPEANTKNIEEVITDNDSGMMMVRVNEGTASRPRYRVKFIERTPENKYGIRDMYNLLMEGMQTSERKANYDKLMAGYNDQSFIDRGEIVDNGRVIGNELDPTSNNIQEAEQIRAQRKDYARQIAKELSEKRMKDSNMYLQLIKNAAPNMALPPGIDEKHDGKYLDSIDSDWNMFSDNEIIINFADGTQLKFSVKDLDKLEKLIYYNLPVIAEAQQGMTQNNVPTTQEPAVQPIPQDTTLKILPPAWN